MLAKLFHRCTKLRGGIATLWLLSCISFAASGKNQINGVRVWPAPEHTRVVFDLSAQPDYSYFTLKNPDRLVIDIKNSDVAVSLSDKALKDNRISLIRKSQPKAKNGSRLVLELSTDYKLSLFPLSPAGQYGDRLVVDLYDKEQKPSKQVHVASNDQQRDVIIGIDAGHGGEDPGSIGAKGTYEKHVTLAIAKKLQQLIDSEPGMKAVMTRSGDYYVNLDKRTQIARREQVDFLVSIHADAFRTAQPSGSSVWVVSDTRVENELARWLVNREKNSELLGGGGGVIKNTDDDNLAFMLADMNKDHSLDVSITVAGDVINQLKKVTKLHKKTRQHASFAVLKATDIPSILVETGFISNHQEEKNLTNKQHQRRLARAIFTGVRGYFIDHPPKDSYLASVAVKQHKVSPGESLSVLAQRYNVSVGKIKSANNLSSNVVRVGQLLKIPRA